MSLSAFGGGFGGGGGGAGDAHNDPPRLDAWPPDLRYDTPTVVQLIGVRPMTLWAWEQQLGMQQHTRALDDASATARRYSERDVVALVWLRNQILSGATLNESVMRLLRAQESESYPGAQPADSSFPGSGLGQPMRGVVNTGPLLSSAFSAPRRSPASTRKLTEQETASVSGTLAQAGVSMEQASASGTRSARSGVLAGESARAVPPSLSSGHHTYPLGFSAGEATSGARELRALLSPLIRAFATFDTLAANQIVSEALTGRSYETLCLGLLQPTLVRMRDLWSRHELTSPEFQFAQTYIRGVLHALFQSTPERSEAPLVMLGSGPRESDDIGALLLALFWRRAGLRIALLGADVEGDALVEEARRHLPALVALCIQSSQRVRALLRVGKQISQLPTPRPLFVFSGSVFVRNPELQKKVTTVGIYLGDDAGLATFHVRQLLGYEQAPLR